MTGERYDVAVIGGGIAGCASAFELARRGLKVVLYEKGRVAGEQSGRNWGFVRQQGRDPHEIPLMMACNRIWQDLEATLEADVEWRRLGVLYLADDAAEMARYEAWLDRARPYRLDSRLIGPREVEALVPGMARAWAGGLFTPSDGQADPVKATTAFARAAERHGATIRTGCLVERIETAGGRVIGLRSERGAVAADAVVVAAGAWTSALLRRLGVSLPQLAVRSSVLRTTPGPVLPLPATCTPRLGFRQRRDGSFNVALAERHDHEIGLDSLRHLAAFWPSYLRNRAGTVLRLGAKLLDDIEAALGGDAALRRRLAADRVLDPAPDGALLEGALARFRALLPSCAGLGVQETWAGMIETTPDALPVLGELPGLSGLVVATGFSGHGFGMGPIAGRLTAELIAEGRTSLDLSAFRFGRYAAGDYGPENAL